MNDANHYANHLPSKLRLALWKRIDRHLQQGEALISTEHFFRVMEQTRQRLRRTVRDGHAGAFLESIGVEVGPTGATPSMAKAIEKALEVNKEAGVAVESSEVKVRRRGAGLERVAVRVSGADLAAAAADEGVVRESLAEDQGSVKQVEHISTQPRLIGSARPERTRTSCSKKRVKQ